MQNELSDEYKAQRDSERIRNWRETNGWGNSYGCDPAEIFEILEAADEDDEAVIDRLNSL